MNWYNYVVCFFAGMFLANVVPHFVHGVSGDRFPTPFAKPPGKGLSSPQLNVVWALINLLLGGLLVWASSVTSAHPHAIVVFAAGAIAMSFRLSVALARKHGP